MKKILKVFLIFSIALLMGWYFPTSVFATEENPVQEVKVEFRFFTAEPTNINTAIPAEGGGYWQLAESYTAVSGASNGKKLEVASNNARKYSPALLDNVEYTFAESWIDDFGNIYETSGRLTGDDFINMFADYEGPSQILTVYAQYNAEYRYNFTNNEIDNVANGSHSEIHIIDSKTSYHYSFITPADIPDRYTFLYWDSGDYGVFYPGDTLDITNENIGSDATMNFVATYEYTPTSLVQVVYQTAEGIIYQTDPSDQPINIKENAPTLENGQWLFNTCPCVNDVVYPKDITPIITTVPIEDEPVITVYTIYGVLDGADGLDGANGKDGIDGINGTDGIDGQDGQSAYELAVSQGFEGTLEEWLESLKGEDGIDGINGQDGLNGEDGKSAYDLAVEEGFEGTSEEWLESLKGQDGADGEDGTNGIDGADGVDGKSAYELAIDEGFTGTTEEWLESLKGEDGVDGKDGIDGEDGIDGTKGETGEKGDTGEQGLKGESAYEVAISEGYNGTATEWLASLVGPTGLQGIQGEQGIQGIQGVQGLRGIQGIQGVSGIQGIQGIQGVAGKDGKDGKDLTANTINLLPTSETETIADDSTPLSRGINLNNNAHWGFVNLVFMLLTLFVSFVPIIFTKKDIPDYIKIIISLFSAVSILTFVLTEDISTPMYLIDSWTWLMGLICICNIILVCAYYLFLKKEEKANATAEA